MRDFEAGNGWVGADPATLAKAELKRRRFRDALFPAGTFGEPGWDILVDLYVARADGRRTAVSDACVASGVPQTTALRWVNVLVELGLVRREHDPRDGRRVLLALTDDAAERIERTLQHAS